ncbi:MAG: hypothetical protein P4L50_24025 [Anaerolineaceae bacterium]|nr:hypothetical protein [Anaerolineaceae bacterium]
MKANADLGECKPHWAKTVGRMTANSRAPAVIIAIHKAIEVWILDLPPLPEKFRWALKRIEQTE